MSDEIKIDLSTHEELICHTEQLMEDTLSLCQKLESANAVISNIAQAGSFKDQISSKNELSRFVKKAQTLYTLAEVMNGHALDTFKKHVDTDKLLALKITGLLMADPQMDPEVAKYFKEHPNEAVDVVKEAVVNNPDMKT